MDENLTSTATVRGRIAIKPTPPLPSTEIIMLAWRRRRDLSKRVALGIIHPKRSQKKSASLRKASAMRIYGIRPDYCLTLRMITTQEFRRKNAEFVDQIFGDGSAMTTCFTEKTNSGYVIRTKNEIQGKPTYLRRYTNPDDGVWGYFSTTSIEEAHVFKWRDDAEQETCRLNNDFVD